MTPGKNEKYSLAGALHYGRGPRKNHTLLRDLLTLLDRTYPESGVTRLYVVVDTYSIHQAQAVEPWVANHPRFALLWWPTYGPRANPIARVFGGVHDMCTRHHKRKRLRGVVGDVEQHLHHNGPWLYKLSRVHDASEVTAAVVRLAAEAHAVMAA